MSYFSLFHLNTDKQSANVKMNITLTGASGFIGQHLVPALLKNSHNVTILSRRNTNSQLCNEIAGPIDRLKSIDFPKTDILIHLAGLAHSKTRLDQSIYQAANCDLTVHLAKIAVEVGAKQFIFLSTSKVHGEESTTPFTADSAFNPLDIYSETKVNAELALKEIAGSMNIVSIRPPVVYGKNPKANIATLASSCKNKSFLPLPMTKNKRSFLFVGNLCSAIDTVMKNPAHGYQGFVLDDGYTLSTEELVLAISQVVGSSPKIVKIPNLLLSTVDSVFEKTIGRQPFRPLYSNFELDSSTFCNTYNWVPPYNQSASMQQSFEE